MHRRLPYRALPLLLALLTLLSPLPGARAEDNHLAPTPPARMAASDEQPDACQALMTRIDEQNRHLSQELRQIKREITVLNQNLDKPGLKDAMAGIGYIFGLFGTAAFVAARRRDRSTGES